MLQRPPAYEGKEPYVFISYSHNDKERVYPLIQQLQDRGVRVWYDEGIELGSHWDYVIPRRIHASAYVVCFITESFLESENCLDEMFFARDEKKGPLIIYMDQVKLPMELRFRYGRFHAWSRDRFTDEASFIEELYTSEVLRPCLGTAEKKEPDIQPEALYNQGVCHENKQEYAQALECYRQAADRGHLGAMTQIGYCYEKGYGVEENMVEAVNWYRKAAEKGNTTAQTSLGNCYYYGRGVSKDYIQAVQWYRKAAEAGDAKGQNNLGVCYALGEGVPKDDTQAVCWYTKSAEQGYAIAQNNLGNCYYSGRGVQRTTPRRCTGIPNPPNRAT